MSIAPKPDDPRRTDSLNFGESNSITRTGAELARVDLENAELRRLLGETGSARDIAVREAARWAFQCRDIKGRLNVARDALGRLASTVPFPTPDDLGFIHPQITERVKYAREALAAIETPTNET